MKRRPRVVLSVQVDDMRPHNGHVLVYCNDIPPSLNEVTSMVPMVRSRETKRWRTAFADAARDSAVRIITPVRLTLAYTWPDRRRRDRLNYPAKWAIDGLVEAGLLPDDDSEVIDEVIRIRFTHRPGVRALVIGLESLEVRQ